MPRIQIYEKYAQSQTVSDMLYRVARRVRHRTVMFFKAAGIKLTPEQWRMLLQLAEQDGQPQSALADPVLTDHPNITRIIDGLEKRRLVLRTRDPNDRRSTLIFLTKEGKDTINRYLPIVIEEKALYYDGLDETEIKELARVLTVIESNLES